MAETVLNSQEQKVDSSLDGKEQKTQLKRIIGLVLLAVMMVAVTFYVGNLQSHNSKTLTDAMDLALQSSAQQSANYRAYVAKYQETKIQLDEVTRKLEEVNKQLDAVNAELALTKGRLSETKDMLTKAQEENAKLKEDISGLNLQTENVPQLEAKIVTLKEQNSQVGVQLEELKGQLRAFEADFSNLEEGKSLITLFQNKIKLVKSRMQYLKQEAYFAQIASQKERDRVEALNGNSGYLVREGKAVVANKSYAIDVKIMQ